jgi:hypothetical protein
MDMFVLIGDADGHIIYFNNVAEQISVIAPMKSLGKWAGRCSWTGRRLTDKSPNQQQMVDQDRKENIWIAKTAAAGLLMVELR